jgi:hypothetical protein
MHSNNHHPKHFRRSFEDLLNEARQTLPLPLLMQAMGLGHCCRKSCKSPFRTERRASFSVFQKDGRWWWKDHGTGAGGDEISFLAEWTHSNRSEAFKAYLQMADVTST